MLKPFLRQFTDDREYSKYEKIPHMDSLAFMVQEFVYSDRLEDDLFCYQLVTEIHMFDFMTLAAYFIGESIQEFGKTTIKGFINDLETRRGTTRCTRVEYPDGQLLVTNASYELILDLLWTTFIYASVLYEWSKDEMWADASSMLYGILLEKSGIDKKVFMNSALSKNTEAAKETMLNHLKRMEARKAKKTEERKDGSLSEGGLDGCAKQQKETCALVKELRAKVEELQLKLKENNSEQQWVACFDGFLHPNLNVQAIAHALEDISSPQLPKNERGYWWAFYTVLTEINWIPNKNHKMALQWANLHFNCGWDWSKDYQFKFSDINDAIKTKPSSEWNHYTTGNVIGDYYGELAKKFKGVFVEFVKGDKFIDRAAFIKSGCLRINDGR